MKKQEARKEVIEIKDSSNKKKPEKLLSLEEVGNRIIKSAENFKFSI